MILRKPYAFLIKKFRLIHFVLFLLLSYICYRTSKIYSFFSESIKSKNLISENTGINVILFLSIILVIGIFIIIMILMNKKKKPSMYYLLSIINYSFLIVVLLLVNSQIYNIMIGDTDVRILSIIKDILLIEYFLQYVFVVMALVRATGFNIKKFDFQSDLKELTILSEDNEEFELDIEFDSNDVKTKIKRNIRIFKYVLRENKFLVTFIIFAGGIYLVTIVILNIFIYNKVYSEGDTFKVNDLTVKVIDSYETKLDYKRDKIAKKNYKYNIVKATIKNNGNKNKVLDTKYIKLKTNEYTSYFIEPTYNGNFIDIGTGYKKQSIKPGETKEFIFVFLIKDEKSKETTFEMLINITKKDGEYIYNYAKVKLKLKNTENPDTINTIVKGETLDLKDSILQNTTIRIDDISFSDYETFEYKKNINNKDYNFTGIIKPNIDDYYEKVIMKLKMEANIDSDITNVKVTSKLLENFGEIRYIINGRIYTYTNITEFPIDDSEYYYIDILKQAVDSDNIYLDIVLRNKKYTYILK